MANYNASTIYRGVDKASPVMDKMARNALKNSQKIGNSYSKMASKAGRAVGKGALGVAKYAGFAAVATATYATKQAIGNYLDFESEMLNVKAITRSTAGEYDKMTQSAVKMASKSVFTSKQVAEGMKYLGIAGWETQNIIAGMPGVLQLAAATQSELAMSSDMLSDSMTAFKIEAKDATHVADVFAGVTTTTNTTLEMLKEAMKDAAPAAMDFNVSIEETAAILGTMANNGIKGSRAGTSFRNMTMRLSNPTKQAQKWMNKMNVEVADSEGNFKNILGIIDQTRKGLEGLTEQEQAQAKEAIFGKRAISGVNAVLADQNGKVRELSKSYRENVGVASEMAKTQLDGASGAIKKMNSAWDALTVTLVSKVAPAMQAIAEHITGLLGNDLGETGKIIQKGNVSNLEAGIKGDIIQSPFPFMDDESFNEGWDLYKKSYRDPYASRYTPAAAHKGAIESNLFDTDALKMYKDMYEAQKRGEIKRYEKSGALKLRESYSQNLDATLKEDKPSPMMQLMEKVTKQEATITIKAPKGTIEAPEKLPSNIMLVETM